MASKKSQIMKILTKIALTIALLTAAVTSQAEWVSGYVRSNGTYVAPHYRSDFDTFNARASFLDIYRNPYAAAPSVRVEGYTRSSGKYVAPYVRTPANDTATDNLSYRGYGTIRVPR